MGPGLVAKGTGVAGGRHEKCRRPSARSADISIVALGARTPVGLQAESSAAAVHAGVSRIAEHPRFRDWSGKPLRCARDALIAPGLSGVKRIIEMGFRRCGRWSRKS